MDGCSFDRRPTIGALRHDGYLGERDHTQREPEDGFEHFDRADANADDERRHERDHGKKRTEHEGKGPCVKESSECHGS